MFTTWPCVLYLCVAFPTGWARWFVGFLSLAVFVSQPFSCIEKCHSTFFVTPISFLCAHDRGGRTQIFRHKISLSTTYNVSTKMTLIQGLLLFDSVCSCSTQLAPVWLSLLLFDSVCSCSTQFAPVWLSLLLFDSVCSCLTVCSCSTQFAPVWLSLLLFDSVPYTCHSIITHIRQGLCDNSDHVE